MNTISIQTTDENYGGLKIYVEISSYNIIYPQSLEFFENSLLLTSPILEAGTYVIVPNSYSWNSTYTIGLSFTNAILPTQNDANIGKDASE